MCLQVCLFIIWKCRCFLSDWSHLKWCMHRTLAVNKPSYTTDSHSRSKALSVSAAVWGQTIFPQMKPRHVSLQTALSLPPLSSVCFMTWVWKCFPSTRRGGPGPIKTITVAPFDKALSAQLSADVRWLIHTRRACFATRGLRWRVHSPLPLLAN